MIRRIVLIIKGYALGGSRALVGTGCALGWRGAAVGSELIEITAVDRILSACLKENGYWVF